MKMRTEPFNSDFFDESYFQGGNCSNKRAYAGYGWEVLEGDGEWNTAKWLLGRFDLQNKKVLELGCATGRKVGSFRRMGVQAWGIDISRYAVDRSADETKPYLICQSCEKLSFEDNSFDLVFGYDFLEHLTVPQIESTIREAIRVSNHVFFQFYCNGKGSDIGDDSGKPDGDTSHISVYSTRWWVNKIESLTDLNYQMGNPEVDGGSVNWFWIWKNLDISLGAGQIQRLQGQERMGNLT